MNYSDDVRHTAAYLICTDCRLGVLLGDTTASPDLTITAITTRGNDAFHRVSVSVSESATAAWRLITEHCGHIVRVLAECWYAFDTYWAIPFAGVYPRLPNGHRAVRAADITGQAYTHGWPHHPAVAEYAGATPAPRRNRPTTDDNTALALLVCLPCRIALDLGDTTVLPDGTNTMFTQPDATHARTMTRPRRSAGSSSSTPATTSPSC